MRAPGRGPASCRPAGAGVATAFARVRGVAARQTWRMQEWALAVIAGTLLAYSALQAWRPGVVPPAIAFTAAGLLVGTEGLGWLELSPDASSLRLLAEGTLALVLFSDAARIDLRALRDGYAVPARLLGIALPLTIAAGTLAAIAVLPQLTVAEAAALASCWPRPMPRSGSRWSPTSDCPRRSDRV
jgi:4-amino-4-deoxy-L-arabinose transferase-like glycosyltransferase